MPYNLSLEKPEVGNKLCLVIWGKSCDGSLRKNELAPHIGLIAGGKFADYQSYDEDADYSDNYSAPWYFLTEIECEVDKEKAAQIKKLAKNWGKWLSSTPGVHSKWPYNCRSFVAYVLFKILNQDPKNGWAGLGPECRDGKKMLGLTTFVEQQLLSKKRKKDDAD